MASKSGTNGSDLTGILVGDFLLSEPWRFEFFQAVRLLERMFPEAGRVGDFLQPSREVVRFSSHPSTSFPASQIQGLQAKDHAPISMEVNFMGLVGALGLLPTPYTTLVNERLRNADTSLRDFFDIFNHRSIALFYQAWSKHQLDVHTESGSPRPLARELLSLIGLGTSGLQDRLVVSDEALLFYSGLLSQLPRSASAFRQILVDYFDVPVEIEQFTGCWYRLAIDSQCALYEANDDSDILGSGALLGDALWNQEYKATIVLGPMALDRYRDFLPDGSCWQALRAWARFFSNQELDFDVRLVLARHEVPAYALRPEDEPVLQLGWTSWIKCHPFERDAADTVLPLEMESNR